MATERKLERERGEKEACTTHHPTAKPPRLVGNVKVGFSFPLSWSSCGRGRYLLLNIATSSRENWTRGGWRGTDQRTESSYSSSIIPFPPFPIRAGQGNEGRWSRSWSRARGSENREKIVSIRSNRSVSMIFLLSMIRWRFRTSEQEAWIFRFLFRQDIWIAEKTMRRKEKTKKRERDR